MEIAPNEQIQLFRGLRTDELSTLLSEGIKARCDPENCPHDPCCHVSHGAHIQSGTNARVKSRYISTSIDESTVAWYCCNNEGKPAYTPRGKSATYAEIEENYEPDYMVITWLQNYGATARNRALASGEVLVMDFIPKSSIVAVYRVQTIPKHVYDALQFYNDGKYEHQGRYYHTLLGNAQQKDKYMLSMLAWHREYDIDYDIMHDEFPTDCLPYDMVIQNQPRRTTQKRKRDAISEEKITENKFIGKRIKKKFDGRYYYGRVVRQNREFYKIRYEDGDEEEMDEDEIQRYLVPDGTNKSRIQGGTRRRGHQHGIINHTRSQRMRS